MLGREKNTILAVLPQSIGGRLTISSIIDGYRQNGYTVDVFDILFDKNFIIEKDYKYILGYDFSSIKLKVDNNINIPTVNYFSDCIRSKTSGPEWDKYLPYLSDKDNHVFYWDRVLTKEETIKDINYLAHFVNFNIYKDLGITPEFDVIFTGRLDTDYRLNFLEELIEKLPDIKFGWYAIEKHYLDAKSRSKNPTIIDSIYQKFIDNEQDMAEAINKTKIVFNMHSQGKSSLNYRTFQTIACKRLLISDYRQELDLFEGNMPYYKNLDELVEKIKFFIANPVEYKKTVEACYKIAYKNHNSKNCVKNMIKCIGM